MEVHRCVNSQLLKKAARTSQLRAFTQLPQRKMFKPRNIQFLLILRKVFKFRQRNFYNSKQSVHAIVVLCFQRRVMFLQHGLCSKKTDYVRATRLMCSLFIERRFFGALATCLCFKWRVMHRKTELWFYDDQNGALARLLEHSPFFWNIVHVART